MSCGLIDTSVPPEGRTDFESTTGFDVAAPNPLVADEVCGNTVGGVTAGGASCADARPIHIPQITTMAMGSTDRNRINFISSRSNKW